jgi:hypothetical protein
VLGVELSGPIFSAQRRTVETVSHECGPEGERPSLRELVSSLWRETELKGAPVLSVAAATKLTGTCVQYLGERPSSRELVSGSMAVVTELKGVRVQSEARVSQVHAQLPCWTYGSGVKGGIAPRPIRRDYL